MGLDVARLALERGSRVAVVADEHTAAVTSNFAGATFTRQLVESDDPSQQCMIRRAAQHYREERRDGLTWTPLHIVGEDPPEWAADMPMFHTWKRSVRGAVLSGFSCQVPHFETARYRRALIGEIRDLGGRFYKVHVDSPSELIGAAPVVVDALGHGSSAVFDDTEADVACGDILEFEADPAIAQSVADLRTMSYAFVVGNRVRVGGTYEERHGDAVNPEGEFRRWRDERGVRVEMDRWSSRYGMDEGLDERRQLILEKLSTLQRELDDAGLDLRVVPRGPLLRHTVGARPGGGQPRVETEVIGGQLFVHATRMGGSGWTLAPAVAEQVLALAGVRGVAGARPD